MVSIGEGRDIELLPITGLDLKGKEELLRKAQEHLKRAALLLRLVESPPAEPFRIGKIINIMSKSSYDDSTVLGILLGDIPRDRIYIELQTHSVRLLMAQFEDERERTQ